MRLLESGKRDKQRETSNLSYSAGRREAFVNCRVDSVITL